MDGEIGEREHADRKREMKQLRGGCDNVKSRKRTPRRHGGAYRDGRSAMCNENCVGDRASVPADEDRVTAARSSCAVYAGRLAVETSYADDGSLYSTALISSGRIESK